jgi:REP element-mobilizing transposase RayT
MSYHPRIETPNYANFLTTRSRNSELWFANNPDLEESILGYAARYCQRYEVKLYALAIEGNHIQGVAHFPKPNRAAFMRDLNSSIARTVARLVPQYPGGRFWGRRYSNEFIPTDADIERQFLYTVLQPVQDGLVEKLSDYPFYNCLNDAVLGIQRKFKVVRWTEFNAAKRWSRDVHIQDYTDEVTLEYSRLPGYEHLSRKEYARLIRRKVEERRIEIVARRRAAGLGFAGRSALLRVKPGSRPFSTKISTRHSHRPRSLSGSKEARDACNSWYFENYFAYKAASRRYRSGELSTEFPLGTYRPHLPMSLAPPP